MLPTQLAIAIFPHLIPAATIPKRRPRAGAYRAAGGRARRGRVRDLLASAGGARTRAARRLLPRARCVRASRRAIIWDDSHWWARLRLPEHARPSRVPWAIIDASLESIEGLAPIDLEVEQDPDGEAGQNRQELLTWVYDRHLDLWKEPEHNRGSVDGGRIGFRIEYVGSSGEEALRRPAGAHHRVPSILGRMLLYEPHRLVYPLACEARFAFYDEAEAGRLYRALRLRETVEEHGVERSLLIAVAEDALIAASGAPYNTRNTGRRRFPASAAGERLGALGVERVMLGMYGLPPRVTLVGSMASWGFETQAVAWDLRAAARR